MLEAAGPSHALASPLILVWSSCLLECHTAWAAAHKHCGSLTDWWHVWTPFSSPGLCLRQLSSQHDRRPVPRDTDHWADWAAAGGRAGFALLLYLQTGCFAALGWTRHILGVNEALVLASAKWKRVLELPPWAAFSTSVGFYIWPANLPRFAFYTQI